MRVVFDTNVIVSALLLPDSLPRLAFDAASGRGRLLLSFATLAELYAVLSRQSLRKYLDEGEVRLFLAVLLREAEWVEVNIHLAVCRDPTDNKFLELAVSGRASHIITGDDDLLALDPFRGIRILTPRALLNRATPADPAAE